MKKSKLFTAGALVLMLVLGLVLAGCPTDDDGGGNNNNNGGNNNGGNNNGGNNNSLEGTWIGTVQGLTVTVIIQDDGLWTLSTSDGSYSDGGTYTKNSSGTTATLTSVGFGQIVNVGTGTLVNNNTISLTLNSNSIVPGTHTLTRSESNNNGGNNNNNNSLEGTWTGTVYGLTVTVIIQDDGLWTLSTSDGSYSDGGTYTKNSSGTTATLTSVGFGQIVNVGTGTLVNNNTISLTLNSNSIVPGTHTLTRSGSW